jgi:hypothetical protein
MGGEDTPKERAEDTMARAMKEHPHAYNFFIDKDGDLAFSEPVIEHYGDGTAYVGSGVHKASETQPEPEVQPSESSSSDYYEPGPWD